MLRVLYWHSNREQQRSGGRTSARCPRSLRTGGAKSVGTELQKADMVR